MRDVGEDYLVMVHPVRQILLRKERFVVTIASEKKGRWGV